MLLNMSICILESACYENASIIQVQSLFPYGNCFTCSMMSSKRNETTLSPKGNENNTESSSYGYVIATTVAFVVVIVIVSAVLLVYRAYRKRSGPIWITKFYDQGPYSSMRNDVDSNLKDEKFIIGFSNPIMEAATDDRDSQDGGVKVLSYKPLNTDKQPGEKADYLVQYKFLFPREKLVFGSEIGTGWFGKVYKGEAIRIVPGLRKTKVIIKKLEDNTTSQLRNRFIQELEILKSVNHKNVLGILGKATEKEPYIVVFEYSPMGNLKEFLVSHKYDAISIKRKGISLKMAIDVAAGLQYLHANWIYFSDLAARNCVVDGDLTVKIGDYGISRSLYENDYYDLGLNSTEDSVPIRWLDPENVIYQKGRCLTVKPSSEKSNIWTYGIIVWEIVEFGRQPYEELTDEEVLQSVIVDQLYQLPEPKETGFLASQLYEIMRWCWVESSRRPSIHDMLTYLVALKDNFSFSNKETEPDERVNSSSFSDNVQSSAIVESLQSGLKDDSIENKTISKISESDKKDFLGMFSSSEPCKLNNTCREDNSDVEITEICDDSVPVTVIKSTSTDQEGQNIENRPHKDHNLNKSSTTQEIIPSNSECESELSTPPPVTYIGDPSDGLAEYKRIAQGSQEIIEPINPGNQIVEVKYSDSEPSVIVENCSSGYVVLPGELVRRKSSLRRENAQSRGQSVHFPANILDLRIVHRYYKDEDEDDEDGEVLSCDTPDDDIIESTAENQNYSSPAENQENRPQDHLIISQTSKDIATVESVGTKERPTSPVEKRIKKGLRRKKLDQHADEWLYSFDQAEK